MSGLALLGSADAAPLRLTAEAGIAGLGRAGRWAPVRVSIDNTDRAFRGDIVVSWGDAVLRRAVSVGAPGRADVVVYIRSADVRDVISIRLEPHATSPEQRAPSVDVPIRLQSPEDDVVLCVGSTESLKASDCSATIAAAALPRVFWGYDAIDRVRCQDCGLDALDRDQRSAFERWNAKRKLEAAGVAVPGSPKPLAHDDRPSRSIEVMEAGASAYIALFAATALVALRFRQRPMIVYPVIVAVVLAGSAAAFAAGRMGTITVLHSSRVVQLPSGGSLVAMTASAEYPTFDSFELRVRSREAAVEPEGKSQPAWRFDETGEPVLLGTSGLASHQTFALDGVVDFSPFTISRREGALAVTNASSFDYSECVFSDGLSTDDIGVIRAGGTKRTTSTFRAGGFVRCTLTATPVEFVESRYPVHVEGATEVIAYLEDRGEGAPGGPAVR